jgi:hypothetical protein
MERRSSEQPVSDLSIDSPEESRARLKSMQELICHLLSRNQQLRTELAAPGRASTNND